MEPVAEHPRPLFGLLLAQFFGAFNDNALKVFVALLAMRSLAIAPGAAGYEAASQAQATMAFIALTLPLMVVSLPAAYVADRFSKRSIIIVLKLFEVLLMGAIAYGLYQYPGNRLLPFVILALMGAQSALFSPAKFGLLPEVLPHDELSEGNGLLQMWTMLAIIAGTAAAGPLADLFGASRPWVVGGVLAVFAAIGFAAALLVPRVPPARSRRDTAADGTLRDALAAIGEDRVLRLAILGAAYLWAIASLLGQNILVYSKATLGLSDTLSGLPLAVLGAGIAAGSLLAGRLSAGKVEYGLIPAGAVGMMLVTLALGTFAPAVVGTNLLMLVLGVCGGLILVPINAVIQWRAPAARRGAVIAVANILAYAGILLGSLSAYGLSIVGLPPRSILLASAVAVGAGSYWALHVLPEAFLRLGFVLVTHTVYRMRLVHPERVPESGPALLMPNHVSFIDGLLILASTDRPVRFVIDAHYYNMRLLKPFMLSLKAIPLSLGAGPKPMLRALKEAGKLLDRGDVVCIFPEGQITRTGMLGPFQRGFQRIVTGRDVPIIPVALDRVWGSIFSKSGGRFVTKLPRHFPYPVTVAFGEPLVPGTPIHEARAAVRELNTEAWKLRKDESQPLYRAFIRKARTRPWRFAMADANRPKVSRFACLTGAIALAGALRSRWHGQPRVGVLLPPSVGGALVNFAASLAGRTSVNLNYTSGKAGLTSACEQAGLKTIVTSGMFVAKAGLELPDDVEPICSRFSARCAASSVPAAAPRAPVPTTSPRSSSRAARPVSPRACSSRTSTSTATSRPRRR
jgi:acyl-[acyl-carrier-protein]-phospholipid O-acyltransferase/long-chain-fatty-acid--[acyl-carrier-protein] ligase